MGGAAPCRRGDATADDQDSTQCPAVGFTTRKLTIKKGQVVRVVNGDGMRHSVTSKATDSHHQPLFSRIVNGGTNGLIRSTAKLAPGKYPFYLQIPQVEDEGPADRQGPRWRHNRFRAVVRHAAAHAQVITAANITIPVERAAVRVFASGPKTTMWTYGGTYPGPTIGGPPARTPRSPSSTGCRLRPAR